jgi:hypothetical protein
MRIEAAADTAGGLIRGPSGMGEEP